MLPRQGETGENTPFSRKCRKKEFSPKCNLFFKKHEKYFENVRDRILLHSQQFNCMHSYGIKGTLYPYSSPLYNEPVPQVLKQVVNLSCWL